MHDIKAIRDNPDAFDRGLARRGLPPMAAELLKLDAAKRDHMQKLRTPRPAAMLPPRRSARR